MCKHGTTRTLEVPIGEKLSYTGKKRMKKVEIDNCIYWIVKALNDNGIPTVASCCGHGNGLGTIALEDGRCLVIAPTLQAAEAITDTSCSGPHTGKALAKP